MNLAEMSKYVDWINIMTYDFHGLSFRTVKYLLNLYICVQVVGSRKPVIMLRCFQITMKQQRILHRRLLNRDIIVMVLYKDISKRVHLVRN